MDYRTNIINAANDWAAPGEWKPDADTLVSFFNIPGRNFGRRGMMRKRL
jgi:hypothetical protein